MNFNFILSVNNEMENNLNDNLNRIEVDNYVKVKFINENDSNSKGIFNEFLWLLVKQVTYESGYGVGILDNNPIIHNNTMKNGDIVKFNFDNVYEISNSNKIANYM